MGGNLAPLLYRLQMTSDTSLQANRNVIGRAPGDGRSCGLACHCVCHELHWLDDTFPAIILHIFDIYCIWLLFVLIIPHVYVYFMVYRGLKLNISIVLNDMWFE